MNSEVIEAIADKAQEIIQNWNRPIIVELDILSAVGLIGAVQVALRHPGAREIPTMLMVEKAIVDLIEKLDPAHGDLWKFLNMGFNRTFDR